MTRASSQRAMNIHWMLSFGALRKALMSSHWRSMSMRKKSPSSVAARPSGPNSMKPGDLTDRPSGVRT